MSNEHYRLSNSKKCKELLAKYPNYKVFWRSGFQYRGAGEYEMPRDKKDYSLFKWDNRTCKRFSVSFEERMQSYYNWSAAIDIDVDHENKELHFNGFSENDLY